MKKTIPALAAVAMLALGASLGPAGATGTPPTFGTNLLLSHSSGTGEPSIRTDSLGRSFVIAPTGVPAGCKAWRVAHDGSADTYLGYPDGTAGGGDCDWAVGPKESGGTAPNLAYSSLTLPNITTGHSDDGGTTFGPPNVFSQQVAGDDRMWMAADTTLNATGHDTVYMTYHDVSAGEIEMGVSLDGGETYVQSTPVINPTDVPAPQWSSAGAGNELGNIVARRDPATGALTLYSIFETPDSPLDSAAQLAAQTTNFNRVYVAVGTVTNPSTAPTVAWRDYEVWHGPAGARLNRIFPVVAVDAAGRVYAVFADGNHVYFKGDTDGTHWDAAAAPTEIDRVAGLPTGYNTALMPWAVAGGDGKVDVVWYGASGGAGAQPSPNDDPGNRWVVWLAQTLDGGATWAAAQASDHVIHTGSICIDGLNCDLSNPPRDRSLLDFFQVEMDPTNGAATIAYADDHASPGTASTYYVRQCTGSSLLDGTALTNDCVAPAPPVAVPQGSTCPGPQVVDFTGDAPNNYPGGDGSNIGSLDVVNASFAPAAAGNLLVTLTLQDLEGPPPPANLPAALWRVHWTYDGVQYAVEADSNGGQANTFTVGTMDASDSYTSTATVPGTWNPGPNGTITWTVPLGDVGNPPTSATLDATYAEDHGAIQVAGGGLFYTAPADRAPDGGSGSAAIVGGCTVTSTGAGTVTGSGGGSGTAGGPSSGGSSGGGSGGTPSGGGSSSGGGTPSGGSSGPPFAPLPPAQPIPTGGVAAVTKRVVRFVRGAGSVHALGRIGSAAFSVDLRKGPGHKVTYLDRKQGVRFRSLGLRSVRFGTASAILRGVGLLNGHRVRFAATAIDGGRRGDLFRIAWAGGRSHGGVLLTGGLAVR
jgi:hypothetical protein